MDELSLKSFPLSGTQLKQQADAISLGNPLKSLSPVGSLSGDDYGPTIPGYESKGLPSSASRWLPKRQRSLADKQVGIFLNSCSSNSTFHIVTAK